MAATGRSVRARGPRKPRARDASRNRSNPPRRTARPRKRTHAVSTSRLVEAPPSRAFDALSRPQDLSRWFTRGARARLVVGGAYANRDGDRGRFLEIRRPRILRMTWENPRHCPGTEVLFRIARETAGRSRVAVRHARLRTKKDADKMKAAWAWALDSFRSYLETGAPIGVEAWERDRRARTKRSSRRRRSG